MWFTAEKVWDVFQSRTLYHSEYPVHGFRWYGNLSLADAASINWMQCNVKATGLTEWVDRALKFKKCIVSGSCGECGAKDVPVYTSSKQYGQTTFCSECWHTFLMERTTEGV